jgi:hypothetical protein
MMAMALASKSAGSQLGLLITLLESMEDQECKEMILCYCVLSWRAERGKAGGKETMTMEEIELACEGVLFERFGLKVNFDAEVGRLYEVQVVWNQLLTHIPSRARLSTRVERIGELCGQLTHLVLFVLFLLGLRRFWKRYDFINPCEAEMWFPGFPGFWILNFHVLRRYAPGTVSRLLKEGLVEPRAGGGRYAATPLKKALKKHPIEPREPLNGGMAVAWQNKVFYVTRSPILIWCWVPTSVIF